MGLVLLIFVAWVAVDLAIVGLLAVLSSRPLAPRAGHAAPLITGTLGIGETSARVVDRWPAGPLDR